jgi:hypothetical protein
MEFVTPGGAIRKNNVAFSRWVELDEVRRILLSIVIEYDGKLKTSRMLNKYEFFEGAKLIETELVKIFFQHFSTGELDQAFALVSNYVSWWVPGDLPFSGTKTKAQYMQVVGRIQQGFPGGMAEKDPSTERVRIENSVHTILSASTGTPQSRRSSMMRRDTRFIDRTGELG